MGWADQAIGAVNLRTPLCALVTNPILAGQGASVTQTPRIPLGLHGRTQGLRARKNKKIKKRAKLYLCVAVPAAAAGVSQAEAGARLLGEISRGEVRGEPQWLPASSWLVRTRTNPTLPSLLSPSGSPAPPVARHTQRPVHLLIREIRVPLLSHCGLWRRSRWSKGTKGVKY